MKTNRELLELAAKAAGLEFKWRDGDPKWGREHVGPAAFIDGCWQAWSPARRQVGGYIIGAG